MISIPHLGLGVALSASSALGVGVRNGWLRLGRHRWLHHALYATALAGALVAVVSDAPRGRPTWPVAVGTLGVLACLPTTRGGSAAHTTVAAGASAVYVIGTLTVALRAGRPQG